MVYTDYADRTWPRTASILDLLRCSITFSSCEKLVNGIKKFEAIVNSGNGGCIRQILRVKNMFKIYDYKQNGGININNLELNKFTYCDIKYNVLIVDYTKKKSQIGEIQLLVSFMETAKKMGHSLYGVLRRKEFVDDIIKMIKQRKKKIWQITA